MAHIKSCLLAAGMWLCLSTVAATADPISVGTWYEFGFSGGALTTGTGTVPTTNPIATVAPDAPWTFTLALPGQLLVTDIFLSIDQFELFNFGTSLGSTSIPVAGGACGPSIACALADISHYSQAIFALLPGDYSITGVHLAGVPGAGAFQVSAVPLPAALPLFAGGLGLLGWMAKRRRSQAAHA
jgi:hypothetical protein